ncbi:MAG: adenine phosphoribosyltransferase [Candidatus Eisenbacteria sp.]|nr:adenine phosphoribosyltransferase [Candidatus Eisenbacteria bacterium]
MQLQDRIRSIPDFPKKGIVFRDITTLLKDGQAFARAVDLMAEQARARNADVIACVEARGFLFGSAVAKALGIGVIPIRKPGKLPAQIRRKEYTLEYGTDVIEVHEDAITDGLRVFVVDDLLATGGTALAAAGLIEDLGGVVAGFSFLIDLAFLGGGNRLKGYDVHALIVYES